MATKEQIESFAKTLSSNPLILIDFDPVMTVQECHDNVRQMVNQHGGKQVFGWHFAENNIIPAVGAIWHSVWQKPDGSIMDITSRSKTHEESTTPCGEGGRLYFLIADQQTQTPGLNKFFALTKNKDVARKVRKLNQRFYDNYLCEKAGSELWKSLGLAECKAPILNESVAASLMDRLY